MLNQEFWVSCDCKVSERKSRTNLRKLQFPTGQHGQYKIPCTRPVLQRSVKVVKTSCEPAGDLLQTTLGRPVMTSTLRRSVMAGNGKLEKTVKEKFSPSFLWPKMVIDNYYKYRSWAYTVLHTVATMSEGGCWKWVW